MCLYLHSGGSHMWNEKRGELSRLSWSLRGIYVCAVNVGRSGILFCMWWWFLMLECSGLSAVRGKGEGFTDCGSLWGCQRLRLEIWSGFRLRGFFAATSVWMWNFSSLFRWELFCGNVVFAWCSSFGWKSELLLLGVSINWMCGVCFGRIFCALWNSWRSIYQPVQHTPYYSHGELVRILPIVRIYRGWGLCGRGNFL